MKLKKGDKYGEWTVLEEAGPYGTSGARSYLCRCSCGTEKVVRAERLVNGLSKSCGCKTTGIERVIDSKPTKVNSSGYRGVHYNKKDNRWEADITYKGTRKYLGQYIDKKDAIQARMSAEEMLKRTGTL